jgi:hypothetical protein
MILRDEMLDEWLVCIACEKMKQLLRCWNPFLKQYVTIVEHPIVKIEQDAVKDVRTVLSWYRIALILS